YFEEYVKHYTNAATLVTEEFEDMEVTGLFSGWNEEKQEYDPSSWRYEGQPIDYAAVGGSQGRVVGEEVGGEPGMHEGRPRPNDPTLQHPRCVFQILKRHFSRYTPEMVERVTGCPKEAFFKVAEAICENSGPERTTALCYAVGWTQHSKGVQIIRTAAILQLLLGNIGRPGGGIMALRGHATIQGSTDIATLYNILPGYLPMPDANKDHETWKDYVEDETAKTGWWANFPKYITSQMKAWYGEKFDPEGGELFDQFPRLNGDHSYYPTIMSMMDRDVKGAFVFGQNFAVGGPHARLARDGARNLDWLVVLDAYEVETADIWKMDGVRPEDCGVEVFFVPAALVAEKEGSFTQTQRMLQWHDKSVEPPGDARSDAWFLFHLGRRIKDLYKRSRKKRDALIRAMTWDYPTEGERDEPDIESILKEVSGYKVETGEPVSGFAELKDDGSTACGGWIYSGVYADGVNQARRRKPRGEQDQVAAEWGWAWPANRRILYNRASADPEGKPWSERKKYIWWDEEQEKWVGHDVPDFQADKAPSYRPDKEASGVDAIPGDGPFIVNGDGLGWLLAPVGLKDGPLPVHYEPVESPVPNLLYNRIRHTPAATFLDHPDYPDNPPEDPRFPYVVTTYRLTEHHTSGAMSRWIPWLSELQPELFAEISPELAEEKGIGNTDWVTISTNRGKIHCKVLVSDRIPVYDFEGRRIHTIGLPYHWGPKGVVKGDIVNDLMPPIALEANVAIHEAKA
ncbi:MAG TPA: molybdopterin dinucleotide binding domain-containing protein, partial [Rubrobacter sp.]|nr:molybdopterin dinucleotide binding domain-containing protein [Rubrobacter sp.]